PNNDSVRLLGQIVEEMNLNELYKSFSRIRKNHATPRQMLKILLYAYMNRIYSSRDIEKACKRDLNFMYLLEGKPAPDHSKIARFRSLYLAPIIKNVFAQFNYILARYGEISTENIFIDGTKIESTANKYTFVWKKTTLKNQQKLMDKIPTFFLETEETFGIKIFHGNNIKLHHLKKLRKKLIHLQKKHQIVFVHGVGHRKTPLQKAIETLNEYLERLKKYNKYLHIAGKRNSFSKTDHDATFMRMKEDAMRNGQLKPAYNLQFGVDADYVVWATIGPQPTDTTTLIPFLEEFSEHFSYKYKNIVADAGYESEENYLYLKKCGYSSYIKPSNYEISKKRKYKTDIGRRENMDYNEESDSYTCFNNKNLVKYRTLTRKSKTGYISEKTMYRCENCSNCPYKTKCIKGNNSKTPMENRYKSFEVAKTFYKERTENLQRIKSEKGILLRINRSIQAEGSFAALKGNMSFRRFLTRGSENVLTECMLLAFAHNVNKLHNKIQSGNCGKYLYPLHKLA
ncbi:MAG: IS1182 family transposase, partial [Arcobacteraceae bacterium]